MNIVEARARAQAIADATVASWNAANRGHGVKVVKETELIYGWVSDTQYGVVTKISTNFVPKEQPVGKLVKTQRWRQQQAAQKARGAYFRSLDRSGHFQGGARASVAGSVVEDALLHAALFPEETARGHAASVCRSQHVQRAHVQHLRASEGAPLSTQVESARRASQHQAASQYLPPVSGEVRTSQSGDWQQQAAWGRAVNRLTDPRESK